MPIEPLAATHDLTNFDCGEPSLNDFLLAALRHQGRDYGRTFVAVEDTPRVLGYYTITSGSVDPNAIPSSTPKYPQIPSVLLARLAVDISAQRRGLGKELLLDALRLAQRLADLVGVNVVAVDALHQQAKEFYLGFGFTQLLDDQYHLYLPMKKIRKLSL
ncbi:MAG: GNAT family N-acetyltransferase [Pyrinomonadaceae bacterium]